MRLSPPTRRRARPALPATLILATVVAMVPTSASAAATPPTGGVSPTAAATPRPGAAPRRTIRASPPRPGQISRPTWLTKVTITEYFPVPESWFSGRRVDAPGLGTRHRVDWLYSARGLSMEGEGMGLDGRMYHIDGLGRGGWVDKRGTPWCVCAGVYWRAGGYWYNGLGQFTWPYERGGWFRGTGVRFKALPGVSFKAGVAKPLTFNESVAVDPSLIPLGSKIYIPAYKRISGGSGWYYADDTGGAINGRHLDVYRTPPSSPRDPGRTLSSERIYVVPPK